MDKQRFSLPFAEQADQDPGEDPLTAFYERPARPSLELCFRELLQLQGK